MNSGIRVMIVDDDPTVRMSLCAYLEDEGFDVRAIGSASEALAILFRTPIDVAIVDLRLGEIGGEALIMQAIAIRPELHCLIYTGSVGYVPPKELNQIGIDSSRVLYKPLKSMETIVARIRRCMEK
jgi:DNA-binding NtrC family response regulator